MVLLNFGCSKHRETATTQEVGPSYKDREVYILDYGTRHKDSALLAIEFQANEDLVENWVYQSNDSGWISIYEDSFDITLTNIGSRIGDDYYLSVAEQGAVYDRLLDSVAAVVSFGEGVYIGLVDIQEIDFTGGVTTFAWTLRVRLPGILLVEYGGCTCTDPKVWTSWEGELNPSHEFADNFIMFLQSPVCAGTSTCTYLDAIQLVSPPLKYVIANVTNAELETYELSCQQIQDCSAWISAQAQLLAPPGYRRIKVRMFPDFDYLGPDSYDIFYNIRIYFARCLSSIPAHS